MIENDISCYFHKAAQDLEILKYE
jgi:hypothetical protein